MYLPNKGYMWYALYDHYLWGNGSPVVIDWSFFTQRAGFMGFAKTVPEEAGPGRVYSTPKSDEDLYLSLRGFSVKRTSPNCVEIQDHYDFTPTNMGRAMAGLGYNPEKALTDFAFLPEWAYQLTGAREFDVYAAGNG